MFRVVPTLEKTNVFGVVAVGKVADLVILNADPLSDIGNTREIHAVILDRQYITGQILDPNSTKSDPSVTRSTHLVNSLGQLTWSTGASTAFKDQFGQPLAICNDIRIRPGGQHEVRYSVDVETTAVQYDLPKLPLSSWKDVTPAIGKLHLAADPQFNITVPTIFASVNAHCQTGQNEQH